MEEPPPTVPTCLPKQPRGKVNRPYKSKKTQILVSSSPIFGAGNLVRLGTGGGAGGGPCRWGGLFWGKAYKLKVCQLPSFAGAGQKKASAHFFGPPNSPPIKKSGNEFSPATFFPRLGFRVCPRRDDPRAFWGFGFPVALFSFFLELVGGEKRGAPTRRTGAGGWGDQLLSLQGPAARSRSFQYHPVPPGGTIDSPPKIFWGGARGAPKESFFPPLGAGPEGVGPKSPREKEYVLWTRKSHSVLASVGIHLNFLVIWFGGKPPQEGRGGHSNKKNKHTFFPFSKSFWASGGRNGVEEKKKAFPESEGRG